MRRTNPFASAGMQAKNLNANKQQVSRRAVVYEPWQSVTP